MTSGWATILLRLSTIRTRLTAGAVAALAGGIAATTMLLVDNAERAILASQHEREIHEAVRSADVLARHAGELQRALAATAEVASPATLADAGRMRRFLEAAPVLRGMFSSLFIADADGRMLVLVEGDRWSEPGTALGDREYFRRTVAERRSVVSQPVSSRASGLPIVIVTAPLADARAVYGVLAGVLRLSTRDLLGDVIASDEHAVGKLLVVTDARGRILAHPDRSLIMQTLDVEPRMAEAFARWRQAGSPLDPAGLRLQQPGQVLAMAAAVGPDWVVWRALPEAELLAPLRAARERSLMWAGAIVAGASLAVFVLIGVLLRPLDELKRRALHLFDTAHPIDAGWPRTRGEIGELTRVLRHVSAERTQLERFNAQVLARMASVMEAAPVGIVFSRAFHFELVSSHLCRLLGRSEGELLGQHAAILFEDRADAERLHAAMRTALNAHTPYAGEWRLQRSDGSSFWAVVHIQPVEYGNPDSGAIWTLSDVSDARAEREELAWSAGHDALTGLANRKLFEQRAASVLAAAPGSMPAALVMIDLDRFKPINDSAGHPAGDAMLKAVAGAIATHVRASDLAARVGGDEFALLLEHCPRAAAERVAESVRTAIAAATIDWHGHRFAVGASLGVAPLEADCAGIDAWIARADAACYAAKAGGRDRVCVAGDARPAAAAAAAPAPDDIEPMGYFLIN